MGTHYNLTKIAEGLKKAGADGRAAYLFHPMFHDLDAKDLQLRGIPIETPEVHSSEGSIGLQIVDLYLWLTNRIMKGDVLPPEVLRVSRLFLRTAVVDSISLEGMARRFQKFEKELPAFEELSKEQLNMVEASVDRHRSKVAGLWADT